MKRNELNIGMIGLLLLGNCIACRAALTTNSWNITVGGKWETNGDWSVGTPSTAHTADTITNGFMVFNSAKAITIDPTTVASAPGSMTISNLVISAPLVPIGRFTVQGLNELLVENTGSSTFSILNTVLLSTGSVMSVSNSPVVVRSQFIDNGYMELDDGAVLTTTNPCVPYVGYDRVAQMAVTGGLWQTAAPFGNCFIGYNSGSAGLLELSSGTISASSANMYIGYNSGAGGELTMSGGTLLASNSDIYVGYFSTASGSITVSGGQFLAPDAFMGVGAAGAGQVFVSGGLFSVGNVVLSHPGESQSATLTVSGGTADLGGLTAAFDNYSASSIWLTGGQLLVSNFDSTTIIGNGNFTTSQMTVSNGYFLTASMQIGFVADADADFTVAGGTNIIFAPQNGSGTPFLHVGRNGGLGHLWITGGLMLFTNGTTTVGDAGGYGQIVVSNGDYISKFIFLGDSGASNCVMNLYGGTTTVYSNLNIGRFDCNAAGILTVAGGTLYVTNAQHNAALDIETGTFAFNSGTVTVDKVVMTNSCGTFIHTGGTFVYGSAILTPSADADGDGIPNGYEQAYGLDPLNPADANADNDSDGMSNLQEYLAGTDPTNGASYFHVTSIVATGNNVLVTWMTGPGKTNALQATAGAGGGSYQTNSFTDLFIVTNTVGTVTNYLDIGGATNAPSRYYRVRLAP